MVKLAASSDTNIAPGIPDITSLRAAVEMGYEVHEDGAWWPTYDVTDYNLSDFKDGTVWPKIIHAQWDRLSVKLFTSPDGNINKRILKNGDVVISKKAFSFCSAHREPMVDCPACNITSVNPELAANVQKAKNTGTHVCEGCSFVFYKTTLTCPKCGKYRNQFKK